MSKKLEVLFRLEYAVNIDTTSAIASFIQTQIPNINISDIKIVSKGKAITAVITSNILSLIPTTENYKIANSNPDLKLSKTDANYFAEEEHNIISEVLQGLTMECIEAKKELEKYEKLKVEHEKLQEVVQDLSKEIVALKDSNEEERKICVIGEIRDYIKELISVYDILKKVTRKRLDQLKTKEISINSYKDMIKKIKEDGSKEAQLKMLNQMKKMTPFMTAIALREENIRLALLGVSTVANAKQNKLQIYSEEAEQCDNLLKFAEEKSGVYEQRYFVYNQNDKKSSLN